jgi:hypothetical protein
MMVTMGGAKSRKKMEKIPDLGRRRANGGLPGEKDGRAFWIMS